MVVRQLLLELFSKLNEWSSGEQEQVKDRVAYRRAPHSLFFSFLEKFYTSVINR
jgi:hypothetical protein